MPLLSLVILKQKVSSSTYSNATTQFLPASSLGLAGSGRGVVEVLMSSFLVGAFREQTAGSSLRMPCPRRMKSLQRMSSRVGLSAGFLTSSFCMSAIASLGTVRVLGMVQLQSLMRWQVVLASSVSKGGMPKQKVQRMTPMLQMSTQKWYPLPYSTSGAMQLGVPQTVRLHSRLNSNFVANPKSPILTLNLESMKMLPSLRSRWMIFWEWMYLTPLTMPSMKDWISGVMKLLRTRMSQFSDWFSHSSRKMQTLSLSSKQWYSSTTLGWCRALWSLISFANLRRVRWDLSSSFRTTLVAALRLVSMFSVMKQLANPPFPSSPHFWYFRTTSSPSMRRTCSLITLPSSPLSLLLAERRELVRLCLEMLMFYGFK